MPKRRGRLGLHVGELLDPYTSLLCRRGFGHCFFGGSLAPSWQGVSGQVVENCSNQVEGSLVPSLEPYCQIETEALQFPRQVGEEKMDFHVREPTGKLLARIHENFGEEQRAV